MSHQPAPIPDGRRSHAWVPPAVALLLLLWVLATLWPGAASGRGGAVAGAGGLSAGGNSAGAGVHAGDARGGSGAGPGGSEGGAGAGAADQADPEDVAPGAARPDEAAPADGPAAAELTTAPAAAPPAAVGEPPRRRRLGFSSDLLAPTPAAVAVPAAAASAAVQGAVGAGAAASFFGQTGRGTRFVYVIDRSGSMRGERFDAARFEIIKSIRSLRDHESFYVIFYSSDFTPLPTPTLLRATAANKERAVDWVRGISTGGGTDPSGALEFALTELRPTTIWLLSDGSFSAGVTDLIRGLNPGAEVQVNTIAFHSQGGAALLRIIADENDGDFQHVGP